MRFVCSIVRVSGRNINTGPHSANIFTNPSPCIQVPSHWLCCKIKAICFESTDKNICSNWCFVTVFVNYPDNSFYIMEIQFEDWQINALAFKGEKSVFALYLWRKWDWWSLRRWALRGPIHPLQIGVKGIYRFTMKALTHLIMLQHFSNSSVLAHGERTKPIHHHLNKHVK